MALRTDTFDLPRLGLTSGEGRKLDLHVHLDGFEFGAQRYAVVPDVVPARMDVSRMTGSGWALRIRFAAAIEGPCARCLEPAGPSFEVDSREVHVPGSGEELASPYVDADEVLDVEGWAHDALALALPATIVCRPDCAGLCPECGVNRNDDPGHAHQAAPDPRWSKLRELKLD